MRIVYTVLLTMTLSSMLCARAVDFDTEIMPILTRHGCNAGSCHGAAIGRGGFKLSLLGSEAADDHAAIVRQLQGRRVNLADADRSLLLRKPSEQVEHEGGLRLDEEGAPYELVRRWIEQGAMREGKRRLEKLVAGPQEALLEHTGQSLHVKITATFNDGASVDVTAQSVLTADDPDAVEIDSDTGLLTVHRRGIHTVIVRFLDRVVPIRVIVPLGDRQQIDKRPEHNRIDALINHQLDQLRLPHSPPASTSRLLRRVTLDLTGRLPTLQQYQDFEKNPDVASLVQRLLDSEDHARYWALKWANVLSIDAKQLQPEGAKAYQDWVAKQIQQDTPVTAMAKAMLTSLGDSYQEGPVNFLRTGNSPGDLAEHTSKVLMGVRLRCANCHNHPLDHWTQDDYHGLAALFARVRRGRVVTVSDRGEVTHPVSKQPAIPRIPGDRYLDADADGRNELADWLAGDGDSYLATVTVNRIWKQLMGRGLVEPVDDLRATNPATNPELLAFLADDFARGGYRMKRTIKAICLSAAYRRSSQSTRGNENDGKFFSRALIRPLEAEVIADAIGDATGVPVQHGQSRKTRAVSLTNNRIVSPALDVLGRCDRSTDCTATAASSASLARTLHLINGPLINDRVSHSNGRLAKWLATETADDALLERLFVITVGGPPQDLDRIKASLAEVDTSKQRTEWFEDLFWSLLTSQSFITNH